ncbi:MULTISPECIES: salicylate synthase [Pseudoalteromonas]|uniref:salicylate synthase n=1 Tax=Pseudoalteromonas TaxID=53246 RepID=UPI0019D13A93|nr:MULTISPECIES: salicylate synthase [Pseudoalteromonas]MBR8843076.1 salicylate synthase [Pseudoalteromonas sp. JC3]QUI69019.1 salicylate synthase [Pseudoalteromonas sp. M8]UDM64284.1 salicylate synthase [Pseudoalteromonas piscicida]WJE10769.1 salicylate synthase [Pseudoalteromonas sp. JC3]
MKTTTDTPVRPKVEQDLYIEKNIWQQQSLGSLVADWRSQFSDNVALIEGETELTYAQFEQRVVARRAGFCNIGLKAGDHVMMQLPNSLDFVISCFAMFQLGVIPILAMPAQRESDIVALCELSNPVAYVVPSSYLGHDYIAMAQRIVSKCSSIEHVLVTSDTPSDTPYTSLSQLDSTEPMQVSNIDPTSTALMLLSGGTTGTPKLIPRSHNDYYFNAKASAKLCQFDEQTTYLAVLPIAHNFPLACPGIIGTLCQGGTVVLCPTPGPDEAFPLIEQHKVTHTALVPALTKLWLEAKQWDETDISSLKLLQVGGAKFTTEQATQVPDVLGCQLQQVFGMAEGLLCFTRLDDPLNEVMHTQGRPLCDLDQIRIVDEQDNPVARGSVGELQTKGPYTIAGYYKAQAHNQTTFTADGFYRTGDLVRMNQAGNLIVEGRIKEQINRAGEKIAVAEIEQRLLSHPYIDEAILVPVPDAYLGERSCACIISSQPVTLSEVYQLLQEQQVARFKYPDQIISLSFWPLTAIGKINKKALIKRAEDEYVETTMNQLKPIPYVEKTISVQSTLAQLAPSISELSNHPFKAVYECKSAWSVGLGKVAELHSNGNEITLQQGEKTKHFNGKPFPELMAQALQSIQFENWRLYGVAKFELASVFHGIQTCTEHEKSLQLFVPKLEVRLEANKATLRALTEADLKALETLVLKADTSCLQTESTAALKPLKTPQINTQYKDEYKTSVAKAIEEICNRQYQKVILSRRIHVPDSICLNKSFRYGRLHNSPARSFLYQLNDFSVAGFSPETLLEASNKGYISTQPLAGTRSLGNSPQEEQQLREELLNDTKEIAEHAVSVKLAQEELEQICEPSSISVSEFMAVRRRGSVQHLASRVCGQLSNGKNPWHAFQALFPAVTASGIPKREAIEAILRLEPNSRDWYSGCVMIVDNDGFIDSALVLRSIYRANNSTWLQAGAGVIDQSKPERELTETIEKLSCIANYLIDEKTLEEAQG